MRKKLNKVKYYKKPKGGKAELINNENKMTEKNR